MRRKLWPAVVSLRNFRWSCASKRAVSEGDMKAEPSRDLAYIGLRIAGRVYIFPFFI